jgi:hypothetical protein
MLHTHDRTARSRDRQSSTHRLPPSQSPKLRPNPLALGAFLSQLRPGLHQAPLDLSDDGVGLLALVPESLITRVGRNAIGRLPPAPSLAHLGVLPPQLSRSGRDEGVSRDCSTTLAPHSSTVAWETTGPQG